MLMILTGESGSGKSSLQLVLFEKYNVEPIVNYTTRSRREDEIDGKDYHFLSLDDFDFMCSQNKFAEVAEYSNNRWYGSAISDIVDAIQDNEYWHSIVLTPNGMRKVCELAEFGLLTKNVFRVHVQANLDVRVIRYIERCGSSFGFADFAEIYERAQRDFGMFLDIDDICDYTLYNNGDYTLNQMAKSVMSSAEDYRQGNIERMIALGKIKGKPKYKGPKSKS